MAFYNANDMADAASKLRANFTERPGGMFMLDYETVPDWDNYAGFHRALTFSLVQNVSHTTMMMYSDLSLLLLRFAEIVQGDASQQNNAINYYLGQYFFNNGGDYKKFYNSIDKASPFYPFAMMKIAEKSNQISELERATHANPLFVPAIVKLVAKNVQTGNERKALRVINRALDNPNLTSTGRSFFLKSRAQVYLTFGDLGKAQTDIHSAAKILPNDAGILAIQSKIWSLQRRELDTAYEYAIALVHKSPTDIEAWDVLGMAVNAKEGADAALDILERVGQVSMTCSSLFEHLGDLYLEKGDIKRAHDSYVRAIDLSDDGLSIVPNLEKKLRNIR
jgi:tetratricopeptide (TPR) repeat protein